MIKNTTIFLLSLLLLLGCERKQTKQTSFEEEDARLKREQKIARIDSINLLHLNKALMDSAHVEDFALFQFFHDTVPQKLFELRGVKDLSIGVTYLQNLPVEICNLKKLEVLRLNQNKLTNIDNIVCLFNLRHLELRINKLSKLPPNFSKLENLEYLYLSKNDFSGGLNSDLPKKIKEVELFNCNLTMFPAELLELPFLEKIDLQDNPQLKEIPTEIRKLSHLRELVLTRTGIGEDQISELKRVLVNCTIYN